MKRRCLYCYEELSGEDKNYHVKCARKFFGTEKEPSIDFKLSEIKKLALENLIIHTSVTGVQPKLSLDIPKKHFILKPPVESYPEMPEVEDLTMKLADILKIKTAEHSLIRLASGELAYITKRFDRTKSGKVPVEDMAQITGVLTEHKYRSSMEKIGKAVKKYSSYPGADLLTFYEMTLFSFITGNADMHLKNFSLIRNEEDEMMLSPAYDLLSTKLLLPQDKEEMALTLNGRKNRFTKKDFAEFAAFIGLNETAVKNVNDKFISSGSLLEEKIELSFLSQKKKDEFKNLVSERIKRL